MISRITSGSISRSFEEDSSAQEPSELHGANNAQEPEYRFEGFILAFCEKVMLTPIQPDQPAYKQL